MALLFPFDTTLKGRVEKVEINIGELPFPMFVFPKGSFFVPELYGYIKGTRTMVRPGLDYKVISLNESIPFTNIADRDKTLKENYVRNAILWIGSPDVTIEWSVPYCGGEEDTQPAIYRNYISELYNEAMSKGTVNLFLTPNQAFAGFASIDNTQITDGRNIYTKDFDYSVNSLGWGKIQSAVTSLADVLASGGDPLEIQAFHDWVRKQEEEFTKYKDDIIQDINKKIDDLDNVRVDEGQFIFADGIKPDGNFVEHYGTILRGLDPTEPDPVLTPLGNKGNLIGFYGLAGGGYNYNSRASKLFQKLSKTADNNPFRIKVTILGSNGSTNIGQFTVKVDFINKNKVKPNTEYRLYVVSRELKRVIGETDVTGHIASAANDTINFNFNYPNVATTYPEDVLFAYAVEVNTGITDYHIPDRYRYLSKRRKMGYGITLVNNGLLFTDERILSKNAKIDEVNNGVGTGSIEVVLTREFTDVAETSYLAITPINSTSVNIVRTLQWEVGEGRKRIAVSPDNSTVFANNTTLVIQNRLTNSGQLSDAAVLAEVIVGYLKSSSSSDGYLRLAEMNGSPVLTPEVSEGINYKLIVTFSKNVIVQVVKPIPRIDLFNIVTGQTTPDVKDLVLLGEPKYINNSTVEYTVSFKNLDSVGDSVMMFELKDGGKLKTNVLNLQARDPITTNTTLGSIASTSSVSKINSDAGVDIKYTVTLNTPNLNRSIALKAEAVNPSGMFIKTPPEFINDNVVTFTVTIPVVSGAVSPSINLSYLTPTGVITLGSVSSVYTSPKPHDVVLINKLGNVIPNVVLNEPFRIVYLNQSDKAVNSVSVVKNDLPSSSLEVSFGGDASNNSFLKTGEVSVTGATAILSEGNWITVTSISSARDAAVNDVNYGLLDLKATVKLADNISVIVDVSIRVVHSKYNVRFYDLSGGDLPRLYPTSTDFVVTISSVTEDLSGFTRADPFASNFVHASVKYNKITNVIYLRFAATSAPFDGDFGFNLQKGSVNSVRFENLRKLTTFNQ